MSVSSRIFFVFMPVLGVILICYCMYRYERKLAPIRKWLMYIAVVEVIILGVNAVWYQIQ